MIYREESKQYEEPYILDSYDGRKTAYVIVKDRRGRKLLQPYSITVFKPAIELSDQVQAKPTAPAMEEASKTTDPQASTSNEASVVPSPET